MNGVLIVGDSASQVRGLRGYDDERVPAAILIDNDVGFRDRRIEILPGADAGLLALRRYARAHPAEQLRLAYFGGTDPRDYGISATPLAEGAGGTGTIVVSATHLSGQYLRDSRAYHWLLKYPRVEILNHTLHVFRVPPQETE